MMTMTHAEAFVRTESGKAEFRAHSIKLSRPARNLYHDQDQFPLTLPQPSGV